MSYDLSAEFAEAAANAVCDKNIGVSVLTDTLYVSWNHYENSWAYQYCGRQAISMSPDYLIFQNVGPYNNLSGSRPKSFQCTARTENGTTYECPENLNERCPISEIDYVYAIGYIALIE